jgi:hypothetical protein
MRTCKVWSAMAIVAVAGGLSSIAEAANEFGVMKRVLASAR